MGYPPVISYILQKSIDLASDADIAMAADIAEAEGNSLDTGNG